MAKEKIKNSVDINIGSALKYPWQKMQRVFWYWLILIPIFGWFPLYGYMLDVVQSILKGNDKELPKFGKYWPSFVQGFYVFIFAMIAGVVANILIRIPIAGWVAYVFLILIVPVLMIHYAAKRRFGAFFDVVFATKMVFGNFIEYIVLILKTIVATLFWLLCSIPIITMIWTLPAMQFSSQFLLAQFYRKHHK